jgi:hypothetical protein
MPLRKRYAWQATAVAMALFAATLAHANQLRRMELDEKVRDAEAIVIATTVSVHQVHEPNGIARYAALRVDRVVHGTVVPGMLRLVTSGPIAEDDPWCCTVGTRLLVFVEKAGGYYTATNGNYGVFVLDGNRVIGWPANEGDTSARVDDVIGLWFAISLVLEGVGHFAFLFWLRYHKVPFSFGISGFPWYLENKYIQWCRNHGRSSKLVIWLRALSMANFYLALIPFILIAAR